MANSKWVFKCLQLNCAKLTLAGTSMWKLLSSRICSSQTPGLLSALMGEDSTSKTALRHFAHTFSDMVQILEQILLRKAKWSESTRSHECGCQGGHDRAARYCHCVRNQRWIQVRLIDADWKGYFSKWSLYSFVFHKSCVLFERRSRYDSLFNHDTPSWWQQQTCDHNCVDLHGILCSSLGFVLPGLATHSTVAQFWREGCPVPECPESERLYELAPGWLWAPSTELKNIELITTGHINNLYNTTFWALIQSGGLDAKSAEKELAVGAFCQICVGILMIARVRYQQTRTRYSSRGSRLTTTTSLRSTKKAAWYSEM